MICPNINFNKRMDLLISIDNWIITNVAPDLGLSSEDFLWSKSNSPFKLTIPKVSNLPLGYEHLYGIDNDE